MSLPVISQREAKARNLKHYFTGKPCKNGHVDRRFVSCGACFRCTSDGYALRSRANPERKRQWERKSDKKRREHKRIYNKEWRRKNPERWKLLAKRSREKNHATVMNRNRNRKARRRNAPGSHSIADVNRIIDLQKDRCAYCHHNLKGTYEIDHIVPLSKGGTNFPNNIQILCRNGCNQRKQDKDPIDFARSRGLLL